MKKFFVGVVLFIVAATFSYLASAPILVHAPHLNGVFEERPIRVLFVGDIMLDRNVARTIASEGSGALFASTSVFLADADLLVGNLEGTITNQPSLAQKNNQILRFTFDPVQAKAVLGPLRFDAFSLANNHALDFGEFGYEETEAHLANLYGATGPKSFGHPMNDSSRLSTPLEFKGKRFCFVGYHSLFIATTSPVVNEIVSLRDSCWRIVVFAHWGEEYQISSTPAQRSAAYQFIDAGADLVIGAHPHVVQERETYQGKAIFYSLGNFMFDQNFSTETTRSFAVRADFFQDKTRFVVTPLTIKDQHSAVAEGSTRVAILERLGLVPGSGGKVADFFLP